MKLKNLTDLANLLRGLDNDSPRRKMGFDMEYGYKNRCYSSHPCGSACCIGGWVQFLNRNTRELELQDAVATICPPDMSKHQIYRLCYPNTAEDGGYYATPQQAAKAVEILRDTGVCNWEEAMK
jgi:hypothetical protein